MRVVSTSSNLLPVVFVVSLDFWSKWLKITAIEKKTELLNLNRLIWPLQSIDFWAI